MKTPEELGQLNKWIAVNVFGWSWWRFRMLKNSTAGNAGNGYDRWQQLVSPNENWYLQSKWGGIPQPQGEGRYLEDGTDYSVFKWTTDPAAAMELLKKCGLSTKGSIQIFCLNPKENRNGKASFWINEPRTEAETLELAICLFAKQLFQKP